MHSALLLGALAAFTAASPVVNATHSNWLYTSSIDDEAISLLDRPEIDGIQALYTWKSLEPKENQYDFTAIYRDLAVAQSKGKQLWVQLQDRTFDNMYQPVPKYLHAPIYNNGSVPQCDSNDCERNFRPGGWVTAQWNPHVRQRFQALLKALSVAFDGHIYGMNLAETAIDVQNTNNYTCQGYFEGELANAKYAASVFRKTCVVQYVNFWPCGWANENNYLQDSFDFYAKHGVGVGGPDNIPYKSTLEANAYPYMDMYRNKVPINVVAVQEPDLKEINPNTTLPFTKAEFETFATQRLGARIIFWAISTPWLHT